ncbi:DedA family protein [Candidatus Gracilibacteria bacterium]|nr:DedA family protein [Candidatus Gracilibacteria bacterium]
MHLFDWLLPLLEKFRILDYWIILFIVLLESLPFVGLLIPGSIVVVFAGFLAFSGQIYFWDMVFFGSIGSLLGDFLSFWIGEKRFFFYRFKNEKAQALLQKGNDFVHENRGISLFLGRFIAPLRGIVPYVAGMSHMNKKDFWTWNVLGGVSWVITHLGLGYFLGEAWRTAGKWSLWGSMIVVVCIVLLLNILRLKVKKKIVKDIPFF